MLTSLPRFGGYLSICLLLGGCSSQDGGSRDESSRDGGLLHVLREGVIRTFRINTDTGQLALLSQREVQAAQLLAADPAARRLYVATGPSGSEKWSPVTVSMQSYAVEPQSGALTQLSVTSTTLPPWSRVGCSWDSLTADQGRIHGMWTTVTLGDAWVYYVTAAVAADGGLGAGHFEGLGSTSEDEMSTTMAAVDPASGVFFRELGIREGYLVADTVSPDGTLREADRVDKCVRSYSNGFLLASGGFVVTGGPGLCSYDWRGKLTLRGVHEFGRQTIASAAALRAPQQGSTGWLVVATYAPMQSGDDELHTVTIGTDGALTLRRSLITKPRVLHLALAPSGRFVYASSPTGLLRVYALDADGTLREIERIDGVAGPLAVTPPSP